MNQDSSTTGRHDTADYSPLLRFSAGKDSLAVAMFEMRNLAFGLPRISWHSTPEAVRAKWRGEAETWLNANRPVARGSSSLVLVADAKTLQERIAAVQVLDVPVSDEPEPDACDYCVCIIENRDNYPYCSVECANAAISEGI